jgi:4-amino-4-deoxy-L-arabinose transferase-like glycosyltransferase
VERTAGAMEGDEGTLLARAEGARLRELPRSLLWIPVLIGAFAIYAWHVDTNPPGFYLDEASISYNAYSIAQTGADEHGTPWPVFFQTWDASASINPIYVYVLAAVFKVVGPSILAARLLSAGLGFAAAIGIGALTARATANRVAGLISGLTALATPWLFEVNRLVFEVALFPLVLVALLYVLAIVEKRRDWSPRQIVAIAVLLGLLTYTYTIGRLLGPLLALGLVLFAPRTSWRTIVTTWAMFSLTLLPALIFSVAHPGVLTARADQLSYIRPGMPVVDIASQFASHLFGNLSLTHLILTGDPNIRHHVPVTGSILAGTLILAAIGLGRISRGLWRNPWPRYLLYGLVVALIPASLTIDEFHTLRLVAVPVFLVLFVGLGADWLEHGSVPKRAVLFGLAVLTAAQAILFQVQFQQLGPDRGAAFDAAFPEVFAAALATGVSPIYLRDRGDLPGYIEAYWYGALRGMDRTAFVRVDANHFPPPGAVVLGTDKACGVCQILDEAGDYIAYRTGGIAESGLIANGDFEDLIGTTLNAFATPIYGWSTSSGAEVSPGGAATTKGHLVLKHVDQSQTSEQTSSSVVAVDGGSRLSLRAFVRSTSSDRPSVTIALVETDSTRQFITWHTLTLKLDASSTWRQVAMDPIQLDPRAAFVNVSCYLEPGTIGDEVEIDDIVVLRAS